MLDKRRAKNNGLFPVKLRVYSSILKKAKLYPLGIDLPAKKFEYVWEESQTKSLKEENKNIRIKLQKFETRAHDEAKKLSPFSFEDFEKKYFRRASDADNVLHYFDNAIHHNLSKNKIGSAEGYKCALKSFKEFAEHLSGYELNKLHFSTITPDWLEKYEKYMLDNGKSVTTVGIYSRALRCIFNEAIDNTDITKEIYPFGKKKYQIPQARKVKKALSNEQLKILFHSEPKTIEQEKAKDFWFFSYMCNGMNNKDIALLKYSDISRDKFSYYRAKTFSKSRLRTKIEIYLNDYTKEIINKYGTGELDGYVFPILSKNDSVEVSYKKIKNFTRFINQHIKNLAKANNITSELSSYWARHSFATNSIRKGATKEFISEALNHSNMKTTETYFAGFEDEVKKEFADQLMDF